MLKNINESSFCQFLNGNRKIPTEDYVLRLLTKAETNSFCEEIVANKDAYMYKNGNNFSRSKVMERFEQTFSNKLSDAKKNTLGAQWANYIKPKIEELILSGSKSDESEDIGIDSYDESEYTEEL